MLDFADEEAKAETFAIRFANADSKWCFLCLFSYLDGKCTQSIDH